MTLCLLSAAARASPLRVGGGSRRARAGVRRGGRRLLKGGDAEAPPAPPRRARSHASSGSPPALVPSRSPAGAVCGHGMGRLWRPGGRAPPGRSGAVSVRETDGFPPHCGVGRVRFPGVRGPGLTRLGRGERLRRFVCREGRPASQASRGRPLCLWRWDPRVFSWWPVRGRGPPSQVFSPPPPSVLPRPRPCRRRGSPRRPHALRRPSAPLRPLASRHAGVAPRSPSPGSGGVPGRERCPRVRCGLGGEGRLARAAAVVSSAAAAPPAPARSVVWRSFDGGQSAFPGVPWDRPRAWRPLAVRPRACAPASGTDWRVRGTPSSFALADPVPASRGPRGAPPPSTCRPPGASPPRGWGSPSGPARPPAHRPGSPPGFRLAAPLRVRRGRPPPPASLRVGEGPVPRRVPFGRARPSAPFGSRPAAVAAVAAPSPGGARAPSGPAPLVRASACAALGAPARCPATRSRAPQRGRPVGRPRPLHGAVPLRPRGGRSARLAALGSGPSGPGGGSAVGVRCGGAEAARGLLPSLRRRRQPSPSPPPAPASGSPALGTSGPRGEAPPGALSGSPRTYLVDPASSICLSQRLSHACLSTHGWYSETANGSLNQLWFLWSLAPLLLG